MKSSKILLVNDQTYNALAAKAAELERYQQEERQGWAVMSLEALQRIWDNDQDAAYDNWRELYGLSAQ